MIKITEEVDCIVCGSRDSELISNKGQFGIPVSVCICTQCGLSYLNPRWNAKKYLDFYSNEYDKYYRSKKVTANPTASRSSYYPIIKRLEKHTDRSVKYSRILDIGSGDGSQLQVFIDENVGEEYYAIEPSMHHGELLESRGIKFLSNDVQSDWAADFKDSFDLIIMRHVLEHLLDPVESLRIIASTLRPDGLIYIAVPDAYNPKLPLTETFFRAVHTYYFSKVSLSNLLGKTGFQIVQMCEGDEMNHLELFSIAQRSEIETDPVISTENFLFQKSIFAKGLRKEKSIVYKLKKSINKNIVGPLLGRN